MSLTKYELEIIGNLIKTASMDDLNSIFDMIKAESRTINSDEIDVPEPFVVGDRVVFDGDGSRPSAGVIKEVNKQYAMIKCDDHGAIWHVMLSDLAREMKANF